MARAAGRQAIKPARRKVAGTSRKAVPTATAEAATPAPESPPAPASPAASALCPTPERGPWAAADAAVVGVAHLRAAPPTPCQDAALAEAGPRPIALVCDGAGSAPVSHLGATAVGIAIRRLCRTLEYGPRSRAPTIPTHRLAQLACWPDASWPTRKEHLRTSPRGIPGMSATPAAPSWPGSPAAKEASGSRWATAP